MNSDRKPVTPEHTVTTVYRYHAVTKHRPQRYAPGPGGLDWANQPDPFRRYADADLAPLPLMSGTGLCSYEALYRPPASDPRPLDLESLGLLFELGLGLSAWKEYQGSRWPLRNNPSSGNLHPTEGYLVIADRRPGAPEPGVYHYAPCEHALERRCRFPDGGHDSLRAWLGKGRALVGLSSVHWREAWKYGERAYRYCQHDAGHAIASLRFAARVLGWTLAVLTDPADTDVAALLGLDRDGDFDDAEREHPDCLLVLDALGPRATAPRFDASLAKPMAGAEWRGRANRLSREHVPWPALESVATAAVKTRSKNASYDRAAASSSGTSTDAQPASVPAADAAAIIRQRRSAVAMDAQTAIPRAAFCAMLARTMPDPELPPWDAFPFPPAVFLCLFVQRVTDMEPGLYLLARDPERLPAFRAVCSADYLRWQPVPGVRLPLYALMPGADLRDAAAAISCGQAIAADGAFSLGMIAEFDRAIGGDGPWAYRRLFWETGMIGQVLYLEAEAHGVRATGIGCFFDDLMHRLLGLGPISTEWQCLYHFTVGGPLEDSRLRTHPPYRHLARFARF